LKQTLDKEVDLVTVGRYKFKKTVFEWGRNVLKKASTKNHTYLVIDEIGILEFRGEGSSHVTDEVIRNYNTYNSKIIVVLSEHLTSQFFKHFKSNPTDVEFFSFS